MAMHMEPYSFLFHADVQDDEEEDRSVACEQTLFDAVLTLPEPICANVYSGDLLLAELCQRISAVGKSPCQSSVTLAVDGDLYRSLLTEFVRSIRERDHVAVVSNLPLTLGKHNIVVFTFWGMAPAAWKSVCGKLQDAAGFVGSFQIDRGNPLHTDLLIRSLAPCGFLAGKDLFLRRVPFECEEDLIPCWAQDLPEMRLHFLDPEEYENRRPPMTDAEEVSAAGVRYLTLMENKGEADLYQRLARALLQNDSVERCTFVVPGPFSRGQVDLPEKKFTQYALNLDHTGSGRSKAELFQRLLQIKKEDWRYLAAQIEDAMEHGTVCAVRQTEYGVQFQMDLPIRGLNDTSRTVRTAWIIRQENQCSLVTAYILDRSKQTGEEGQVPHVVRETDPALFCSVLYQYASGIGRQAANKCIPTPVYLCGEEEPLLNGTFGSAWVVIHDARKRFPRWLRKQGIGYAGYRGGWVVRAKGGSPSFEKAKAYADAFAKILRQNGVDCKVESRLD